MSIKIEHPKPSFSEAIRKKAKEAKDTFDKWIKSTVQADKNEKK